MNTFFSQLLQLHTHEWFCCLLLLPTCFVGACSGTVVPFLEGAALTGALLKMPEVLVQTPRASQDAGAFLLLCWMATCLVMMIRFCLTFNKWIDWNTPSFVQLILDFKEWRRERREKSINRPVAEKEATQPDAE